MKIITIGDMHGESWWKIPLLGYDPATNTGADTAIDDFDKVIFIGDYLDSFTVSNLEMKMNLLEIIELKNKYPEKVELLLGNHELHYLLGSKHICSGYRAEFHFEFQDILRNNQKLFSIAYQHDNYLWTHAGITVGWYMYQFRKFHKKYKADAEYQTFNLADALNMEFLRNNEVIFDVSRERGGYKNNGGPFWADKIETYKKPLVGYHQIIGHTPVNDILHYDHYKGNNTSVTYVDTQAKNPGKFYTIDI